MSTLRTYMAFTVLMFLSAVSLSACSDNTPEKPIRIGTNVWPGYEPLYLARDIGLYDKSKVQLVEYPSASGVIRALKSRSIEAAALTLDEVLILLQHKIPVRVVLVMDISVGGDVIIAKPNIKTFHDLAGKRVGVEGSALGAYVLSRALEINGMDVEDISIIQLEADEHERSYTSAKIDAVVTFEPTRTVLINAGGHEVFTSREIPDEVVDVLVIHEDAIAASPKNVRHITQGWFSALKRLETDPQVSAAIIAQRLGVTADEALASFDGMQLPNVVENKSLLGGENPKLRTVALKLAKTMRKRELLDGDIAIDSLLAPFALE